MPMNYRRAREDIVGCSEREWQLVQSKASQTLRLMSFIFGLPEASWVPWLYIDNENRSPYLSLDYGEGLKPGQPSSGCLMSIVIDKSDESGARKVAKLPGYTSTFSEAENLFIGIVRTAHKDHDVATFLHEWIHICDFQSSFPKRRCKKGPCVTFEALFRNETLVEIATTILYQSLNKRALEEWMTRSHFGESHNGGYHKRAYGITPIYYIESWRRLSAFYTGIIG